MPPVPSALPGRPHPLPDLDAVVPDDAFLGGHEQDFERLAENAPDLLIRYDRGLRYAYLNAAAERAIGVGRAEALGRTPLELGQDEASARRWMETLEQVFASGMTATVEGEAPGSVDGLWYQARILPERGSGDSVESLLVMSRDITELRDTQEALRASEAHHRALIEASADVVAVLDPRGTIRYVTPSGESLLGYLPDELRGKDLYELVHPDDREWLASRLDDALSDPHQPIQAEYRLQHRDGHWVVLDATGRNLVDDPAIGGLVITLRDVTARRDAEVLLRASEEQYRTLFDTVVDGILISGADGVLIDANPAAGRILEAAPADLIGRNVLELAGAEARGDLAGTLSLPLPSGDVREIEFTSTTEFLPGRNLSTLRDVTDRVRAEVLVHARVAEQEAVASFGQRALAAESLSAIFDDAVAVVADVLGVEYAKVLELEPDRGRLRLRAGVGWAAGLVGEATVPDTTMSQAGYTLAVGAPVMLDDAGNEKRFELPPLLRDHGVRSGMSTVISLGDRAFGVLGAHSAEPHAFNEDDAAFLEGIANVLGAAILRDLDHVLLLTAEERFRTLVEQLPMLTWTEQDDAERYVSPQVERIFGFTPGEWTADTALGQVHPDDLERARAASPPSRLELRMVHRDGRPLWVHREVAEIVDSHGRVTGIQGFDIDVTERKETEAQFRSLFETANDAFLIAGDNGRQIDVNPAACELFGLTREEMIGRTAADLGDPSQREATLEGWRMFLEQGEMEGQFEIVRRDGERRQLDFSAKANFLPGRHFSIMRDVSDRKRLEHQLAQAQKMEAIGRLAGGIAHDFNNLLLVIRGYGDLLLGRSEESKDTADLHEIVAAADRAIDLTSQLLAFSRRQSVEPATLDVNAVVRDTERMLTRLIGDDIVFATELDPDCGWVLADRIQLEQVLLNLSLNARDAMPDGGRLTVETRNVELEAREAQLHGVEPGDFVRLTVSDTGQGMDAETRSHIFEPFFTTKEPGRGTGLGLATVYGIVQQASGLVLFETEAGAGTSFQVYLPRVEPGTPTDDPSTAASPATLLGTETVLVLDDDELVRQLVAEMLESLGYEVLQSRTGDDAVSLLTERADVDLLLTDVVMPERSGPVVAAQCRAVRPSLKVLFMSGYADDAVGDPPELTSAELLIQKPFSRDALGHKVRRLLEAPA